MGTSTNATARLAPSSTGVLRPAAFARTFDFDEVEVAGPAGYWVHSVWSVTWAFPPGEQVVSSVVPSPSVSLTVERGDGRREGRLGDGVWATGVVTRRFDVTTEGVGGVVGVKFRPGGFTALTGVDASSLTDRVLPAPRLVASSRVLHDLPLQATAAAPAFCDWVLARGQGPDDRFDEVTRVMTCLQDQEVTRVSQLCVVSGLSMRTLQRLLRTQVGVGPKWLLVRQRLHDAMALLDDGYAGPMADLATRLGWSDQNHFIRDFASVVGATPAVYRERLTADAEATPGQDGDPPTLSS